MTRDIWIFLFAIGTILFSWPFMSMFRHNLAIYLFSAWLILIIIIIVVMTVAGKKRDNGG